MKASAAAKVRNPIEGMKIKSYSQISKSDEMAIIMMYRMMVAEWFYPVLVDVELIAKEGIPAFEKTVGKSEFMKVRKFFGIGVKPVKNIKESDVRNILSKLRTVENAQYYLYGFKDLLKQYSAKLTEVPAEMSVLTRAKVVRLYETIFVNYYYFIEDYVRVQKIGENNLENCTVNYNKIQENNAKEFYPEELFYIYNRSLCNQPDNTIIYDCIVHEVNLIKDRTLQKEILRFAELKINDEGFFESVNVASKYDTLGKVRKLKFEVHTEPGVFPINAFSASNLIKEKLDFETLYFIYKSLTVCPLTVYPTVSQTFDMIEGSRIVKKEHDCYVLPGDMIISGPNEASRFILMFQECCNLRYSIKFTYENPKVIDSMVYIAAITFLTEEGYLSPNTEPKSDLLMADKLVAVSDEEILISFWKCKISADDVKKLLNIDKTFEEKVLGYVKEVTPLEAVIDFAVKRGYISSAEDADVELLENVIVKGFEEEAKKLASGEMKMAKFEKAIGITPEFAVMFFDRRKIEVSNIEMKLEEVKKNKTALKNYKLLIMLYCYVIENHIKCGQLYYKERPNLKLSMLRKHAGLSDSKNDK